MHWMVKWAGAFPLFVHEAHGARFTDVDGHEYVDLCLGDTGSMTGHGPPAAVAAIAEQAAKGITLMLPTEDGDRGSGEELDARFGLPFWQFALTATDANRFVDPDRAPRHRPAEDPGLQLLLPRLGRRDVRDPRRRRRRRPAARQRRPAGRPGRDHRGRRVQRRRRARARARPRGRRLRAAPNPRSRTSASSCPSPATTTRCARLTRRHGTLLIIDETHTICAGPGGYTRAHGLDPDILTIGKPIASGVPAAAYGMSAEVAGAPSAGSASRTRRRGHRRDARRQRALAGRDARHARVRAHDAGVRADDPARRALDRRRLRR